jgi:hypothetical protein
MVGGARHAAEGKTPFCARYMGRAIGFAALIIVLGVLLPSVLNALEEFLLTFLLKATAVVDSVDLSTLQ